jgi:hypothetical protein
MNSQGHEEQPADETPIVLGPREQLFHLLAEAAEIEHTLMCSYLYAAFSLKRAGTAGFSEAESKAVEQWRKAILSVAIEEMTHLLLVANLSVAIGGRPHFGRPNFPVAPGYFPSGVVVKLSLSTRRRCSTSSSSSVPAAYATRTVKGSSTKRIISARRPTSA